MKLLAIFFTLNVLVFVLGFLIVSNYRWIRKKTKKTIKRIRKFFFKKK